MSKNIFVSGWCGFPYLFENTDYEILTPFYNTTEDEILGRLKKGGEKLICWSTGAHIALKVLSDIADKFDRIILVSPFEYFCEPNRTLIVKMMLRKFARKPEDVVSEFFDNCGYDGEVMIPDDVSLDKLAEGLQYLIDSRIDISGTKDYGNVVVIHSEKDEIVPYELGRNVAEKLGCKFVKSGLGHFFSINEILEIAK